jgi:hypothetical protein
MFEKHFNGINFDTGSKWWGANLKNEAMELDVVAESLDKKYLLIGECKWSKISDTASLISELEQKASLFPLVKDKKIILAVYSKESSETDVSSNIFLPSDISDCLK